MAKKNKKIKSKDDGSLDKKQTTIYELLAFKERFGLFLGAGSGKTRIIVRHMLRVMKSDKKLNVLIVSTKANTIDTWPAQVREQMEYTGKKYTLFVEHKEYKQITIAGKNCRYSARIMVCSFENLKSLLWHFDNEYFGMVIVDESVRIKNWTAKATSLLLAFSQQTRYAYVLSGLPTPNKIQDIFSQVFLLDGGERLGGSITAFRKQYLEQSHSSKFVWNIKGYPNTKKMERNETKILKKVKDICVTEETETFVKDVTQARYTTVDFELKPKELKRYKKFADKAIMSIPETGANITAVSGAVLRLKLLQFISGSIYEDPDPDVKQRGPRKVIRTTKQRAKALDRLLKKEYKQGGKLIISYGFKHSIKDIQDVLHKHVKPSKVFIVGQGVSTANLRKQWDSGQTDVVVTFAGSIAEGLNLQSYGGSIIFYSLLYNYNHFYQLVRRIKRRGNPYKWCDVYTLCCVGTADELVTENIEGKARLGSRVMSAASLIKILKAQLKGR